MGFLRKNRATIVAGALVIALVALVATATAIARDGTHGAVAIVHAGDGTVRTLPLDADAQVTVTTDLGTNVIAVEHGAVRMVEADCPRGSCLHERAISVPGEQIVCLPHRLWIEVASDAKATGATMDETAVTWGDDGDADAVDLVAR